MSKKNVVSTAGGSVMPKVLGTLAVVGFLAVVVKHPGDAAAWVKTLATWLDGVMDGVASFFQYLAS